LFMLTETCSAGKKGVMDSSMKNNVYCYEPTDTGFRVSLAPGDPHRDMVCTLYPDCDRRNVFSEKEMIVMDQQPFRSVVCAMLSPKYYMDMHNVAGLAGYGRFVAVRGSEFRFLDECEEIETQYVGGELQYRVKDGLFPGKTIKVVFCPTMGAAGLVGSIDCSELDEQDKIYYIHGGMLGWNPHVPPRLSYTTDMCYGNAVCLNDGYAVIALEDRETEYQYENLTKIPFDPKRDSMNCAWKFIDNWVKKVTVRADGEWCIAAPEALQCFREEMISEYRSAMGGVVCCRFYGKKTHYFVVGCGERIVTESPETLLEMTRTENQRIGQRLVVSSGESDLDAAVRIAAYSNNALFGDNVILHGAISWRYGYLGWRGTYGPLAYGMKDQVYSHMDNHFRKSVIKEGIDKGCLMHMLEEAKPDARTFYNMYETFIDQAKYYWQYTGDPEYAKRLFPIVEGCIEREIRRLKPGVEWLFENSLNTWISDSHWSIMGQCTQASAYMYNMFLLASELADTEEKKVSYKKHADMVKEDMFKILWQEKKGIFAYSQDLSNNKLLHPEPELPDIYHPAEFGVTDKYQTYQMLDWVEANLLCGDTDNGGTLYWSSNWHPNSGDTYTHSIYELSMGEEMNLAMIYDQLGLADQGYKIFKTAYMSIFNGREPEMKFQGTQTYEDNGFPPILTEVAADFACQVTTNGTPRLNPQFGDSVSMFGRALYNGVLGVRPMLQKKEVRLSPCLPEEIDDINIQSAIIDYHYKKQESAISIEYTMKPKGCTLKITFHLPVAAVSAVTVNGKSVAFETEAAFGGVQVHASVAEADTGCICVYYDKIKTLPVEARRVLRQGEKIQLEYPGEIIEDMLDPQGILGEAEVSETCCSGTVVGTEGSGVFFLQMRAGDVQYIRPVKVWVEPAVTPEKKQFIPFREEFEGDYEWKTVDIDALFNASSPNSVLKLIHKTVKPLPYVYNQVGFKYYKVHLKEFNEENVTHPLSDARWRSMVDEQGMVMTGEGIPFRSCKEGDYMAVATLASTAYADRITAPVNAAGRAAYLLITGITYPMQSHVENLRITFIYEDGVKEEYPLVNPFDIGDMWYTLYNRFHDTPANGFENLSGRWGALSSAGLDLNQVIETDTEAHILRFKLRPGVKVKSLEMRTIANDAIFALMGISILI